MIKPRPLGFGLEQGECDLSLDGKPPPGALDYFWAVHGGQVIVTGTTSFTTEPVLNVTVSAKSRGIPFDRLGPDLVWADDGVMDRLHAFCGWLMRNQYPFMNRANELLNEGHDEPVNGFVEPVFRCVIQGVRVANPDQWQAGGVRAVSGGNVPLGPQSPAGVIGVCVLSEFKRFQYLEDA